MELKRIKEEMGEHYARMQSIAAVAEADNDRAFTAEEQEEFDSEKASYQDCQRKAETLERKESLKSLKPEKKERDSKPSITIYTPKQPTEREFNDALRAVAFRNTNYQRSEYEKAAEKCGINPNSGFYRAQTVGTTTEGGHLVQDEPIRALEKALLSFGGVNLVARTITTATGAALPWPTVDDTSNVAAIIGENTIVNNTSVVFGRVTFNAFKYATMCQPISIELMQDSSVNLGQLLGELEGERHARAHADHFVNGAGTTEPRGFLLDATEWGETATASVVDYDDLVGLQHSVDNAYDGKAVWVMNRATLGVLKLIKDTTDRPLWGNMAQGEPNVLLGKSVVIDEAMPDVADSATPIAYGDFSKYIVRRVSDIDIRFLQERYIDTGSIGVVSFTRMDAALVDAGTAPIKYLTVQAAA